ncbi:PAAR-like protein [Fusobacterium sp.]|uniref:PAAR-like protein n=1 Tax=Fusobacterium sp. TaxID=68766 RepID=UPI0025B80F78|nr:PAAR-like protein [Fusobacterium sp.]
MSIIDKELLAICNLSNLKMEFANLKKDIETTEDSQGENYTNHTIYSLLEQEREAILNPDKGKRVFIEKNDMDDENEVGEIIYKDLQELKKRAGVVYEYFEVAKENNPEGQFTKEWEILGGFDGYDLISSYFDLTAELGDKGVFSRCCMKNALKKCSVNYPRDCPENCSNKDIRKTFIYSNTDGNILKDIYGVEEKIEITEFDTTIDEREYFNTYINKLRDKKFYPTRAEIKNKKEMIKIFEKVAYAVTLASIIIPALGSKGRNDIIGGIRKVGNPFKILKSEWHLNSSDVHKVLRLYKNDKKRANEELLKLIKKMAEEEKVRGKWIKNEIDNILVNYSEKDIKNLKYIVSGKEVSNLDEILTLKNIKSITLEISGKKVKITGISKGVKNFLKSNSREYKETLKEIEKNLNSYFDNYLEEYLTKYSKGMLLGLKEIKEFVIPTKIFTEGFEEYMKTVYSNLEGNFVTFFLGHLSYVNSSEFRTKLTKDFISSAIKNMKNNIKILGKELGIGNYIGAFLIDLPFLTYNLLNYVVENIQDYMTSIELDNIAEEEKEKLNVLENTMKSLVEKKNKTKLYLLEEHLNIEYEGFRVIVLRKKETKDIVFCFSNAQKGTEVRKNIESEKILNETVLMTLVDSLVLGKIITTISEQGEKIEDYKITVTGFGYGGDLADLYYVSQEYLDILELKKDIRTFKYSYNTLIKSLYEFEPKDIAMYYNITANSIGQVMRNELSLDNPADMTFIVLALLIEIGFNGFTFLFGSVIVKVILSINRWGNEIKNNRVINELYVKLCKNQIFTCNNYNNCLNCKRLNNNMNSYTTDITIKPIQDVLKILKDNTEKYSIKLENENNVSDDDYQGAIFIYEDINLSLEDYLELKLELELKKEFSLFDFFTTNVKKIKIEGNDKNCIYRSKELSFGEASEKAIEDEYSLDRSVKENKKILDALKNRKLEITKDFMIYNGPVIEKTSKSFYYEFYLKENRYCIEKYMVVEKSYSQEHSWTAPTSGGKKIENLYTYKEKPVILEKETNKFVSFLEMNREQKEKVKKLVEDKTCYLLLGKETNVIIKKIKNSLSVHVEDESDYSYESENCIFPFLTDNGKINLDLSGTSNYLKLNKKYIGSILRSIPSSYYKDYSFYTLPEFENLKMQSLIKTSEKLNYLGNSNYSPVDSEGNLRLLGRHFYIVKENKEVGKYFEMAETMEDTYTLKENIAERLLNNLKRYTNRDKVLAYQQVRDYIRHIMLNRDYSLFDEYMKIEEVQISQGLQKKIIIGHMENNKYNDKTIQYLYNDDNIKRGLYEEILYVKAFKKGEIQLKAELDELVSGASLNCSCGEGEIYFYPKNNKGMEINGRTIASEIDTSLDCFDCSKMYCRKIKGRCSPNFQKKWNNPGKCQGNKGAKNLTTSSQLNCIGRGNVSVIRNGIEKSKQTN